MSVPPTSTKANPPPPPAQAVRVLDPLPPGLADLAGLLTEIRDAIVNVHDLLVQALEDGDT